jgi:hypothetical protein
MSCHDQADAATDPAAHELDVHELHAALRRRILCAIPPAIDKLAAAARGERVFDDDLQLRSCMALARLVPALLGPPPESPPPPRDIFEGLEWTPERRAALKFLDDAAARDEDANALV